MTITLCREWLSQGIRPVIIVLEAQPDDLAVEFRELGIECIVLGIPRRGYRRYGMLIARFYGISRRYRPKALLSMPLGWHIFMAIGARLAGVRRIAAHVGNYPNPARPVAFRKFRLLVRLGQPLTDRLVCCSRYVQDGAIANFGVEARSTAVVYNGVRTLDFEVQGKARLEPEGGNPLSIGMVARLEKHKDHATLISAAKILKSRGRTIVVQIVGEGSQRSALQKQIDDNDLTGTVLLLGMRRDVANVLAQLDIFVFSTTPDEGFGIALVEAMLAGVPVIASDVGACREVLDEGALGHLFPAGDATALAAAIDAICADPSEARARAKRAKAKALREFSAEAMARGYADVLGLSAAHDLETRADLAQRVSA